MIAILFNACENKVINQSIEQHVTNLALYSYLLRLNFQERRSSLMENQQI